MRHASRDRWSSCDFIRYCSYFLFFVAFDTDCLSIDRLNVNRHAVLCKRVIELTGGLFTYLSGKHEVVVALELEGVVVALLIIIGLMSCLSLPQFLGYVLGSVLGKSVFDKKKPHTEHRNAMETKIRFDIAALYPRVIWHCNVKSVFSFKKKWVCLYRRETQIQSRRRRKWQWCAAFFVHKLRALECFSPCFPSSTQPSPIRSSIISCQYKETRVAQASPRTPTNSCQTDLPWRRYHVGQTQKWDERLLVTLLLPKSLCVPRLLGHSHWYEPSRDLSFAELCRAECQGTMPIVASAALPLESHLSRTRQQYESSCNVTGPREHQCLCHVGRFSSVAMTFMSAKTGPYHHCRVQLTSPPPGWSVRSLHVLSWWHHHRSRHRTRGGNACRATTSYHKWRTVNTSAQVHRSFCC